TASEGDHANAVLGLAISAFLGGVFWFFRSEERRARAFLAWLATHRGALEDGMAMYEGKRITRETEVVRFQACLSFLVLTIKSPSRYYVKAGDNPFLAGRAYSAVTLLLGWWGIPWGPIYTLQTLVRNLRGGYRQTVSDLIGGI
ncbi:MAG: hypothetical protein HYV08_00280, partial [Deltaproteobacteria bacterium]|nr:hypothetical protein [Deltaproteobacteria bacterium]